MGKFRTYKSGEYAPKVMSSAQTKISTNSQTSMGFSRWVNKDLRAVEETGDWTELLAKAAKSRSKFLREYGKGSLVT